MGRMVTKNFSNISVPANAALDIWSVLAVSPDKVKLHGFELTSATLLATLTRILLRRITAVGTGGTAPTDEELLDERWTAPTATWRQLDTTEGAGGGDIMEFQWEQLGPVGHIWTPETRPLAGLTDGFALTSRAAVAFTASGFVHYEEI